MNKEALRYAADEMDGWLREVRRDFHMHPELGYSEFRTSDKIKGYLDEFGIEYQTYEGSTCVVGLVRGAYPGKTVAIRADIDALPITESSSCVYKSQNEGIMHACGHDAHTTILLGAARYFAGIRNKLHGNVKFFFQPAEESDGGARDMIEAGCMRNPEVDYVTGLHVMPYLPCGTIETKYGALNAASDIINITIKGKTAHGAYPADGVDAVVIAAQVINALQTVVGRNVSPLDSVVFSIGTINGGTARNIIADSVRMSAILRTINEDTRAAVKQRISDIVCGVCTSMGGSADIEVIKGYAALINDGEVVDVITKTAGELLGMDKVVIKEKTSMGVEDFSFFINACKGAFYHLGCGNVEKGITASLHTSNFDLDEDCLKLGVMLHSAIACRLLESDV